MGPPENILFPGILAEDRGAVEVGTSRKRGSNSLSVWWHKSLAYIQAMHTVHDCSQRDLQPEWSNAHAIREKFCCRSLHRKQLLTESRIGFLPGVSACKDSENDAQTSGKHLAASSATNATAPAPAEVIFGRKRAIIITKSKAHKIISKLEDNKYFLYKKVSWEKKGWKRKSDAASRVRTCAGRPHWISSPTP